MISKIVSYFALFSSLCSSIPISSFNTSEFENLYTSTNVENLSSYLRIRHLYHQMHNNRSSESGESNTGVTVSKRRGIVTCAGDGQVSDVFKLIWTIESVWETKVKKFGFTVAHCSEISQKNINLILQLIPYGNVVDICDARQIGRSSVFGMNYRQAKKRLQGFYCKVAALIVSPYPETMLLDLDVVFFKSPHLLFHAPAYRETGTLFFRDRVFFKDRNGQGGVDINDVSNFFGYYGIHINDTSTHTLLRENGVSLFWNYGLGNTTVMQDYQESSVLLINKVTHPVTMQILEKHIGDFFVGFGDKEFYWIAATVAREPFAFEPHLAGQYGDCTGIVIHFDPTVVPFVEYRNSSYASLALPLAHNGSSSAGLAREMNGVTIHHPVHSGAPRGGHAEPFYSNAEHLAENHLQFVGQYITDTITVPVPVNAHNIEEVMASQRIAGFNTWQAKRTRRNCTCQPERYSCQNAPSIVNAHLLLAEWITINVIRHDLSLDKGTQINTVNKNTEYGERVETLTCIPVLVKYAAKLNEVFSKILKDTVASDDCFLIGCPSLPVTVDETLPWRVIPADDEPEYGEYCEPVSFSFAGLARAVAAAQSNSSAAAADNSNVSSNTTAAEALSAVFKEGLKSLAAEARRPQSLWNVPPFPHGQLLQYEKDRAVFMLLNGSLRGFPGLSTFIKMGLDFENVIKLPKRQFLSFAIGDPLPAL